MASNNVIIIADTDGGLTICWNGDKHCIVSSQFTFTATFEEGTKYCSYPHVIDEETEAVARK